MSYKRLKLKLRVFLGGHIVAMVTYCVTKIIPTCSPVIGQFFDTMILASTHRVVIGHVRYINIQAWLRGFRVKIAIFSSFFCPSIPKRDLDTKKTTPNVEV